MDQLGREWLYRGKSGRPRPFSFSAHGHTRFSSGQQIASVLGVLLGQLYVNHIFRLL